MKNLKSNIDAVIANFLSFRGLAMTTRAAILTMTFFFAVALLFSSFGFASLGSQTPEDAILAKGFSAFMDGNDKIARNYFEEVIRINPDNRAARNGLEKVKIRLRKKEAEEKVKARRLAAATYREGVAFLKSNDIVGAVDSFHASKDAVPNYSPAQKELKKIKKRTEKILKAKKFSPSEYAFSLGVLAYLDRDWSKAYRLWAQRQRIEPGNVIIANASARAENRFQRMMFSEKEEFFRRSARTLYEEGYYQRAKESWKQVLAILPSDVEGIEGLARAEREIQRIEGKGRNDDFNALLENALDDLASQKWQDAKDKFVQLSQMSPDFKAAQEYVTHINNKLSEKQYVPSGVASGSSWRPAPSVVSGNASPLIDEKENYAERRQRLESLVKRDPANIKVQQELDKVVREQEEEGERVYKDGLIAYSQGNRAVAITKWKQVLLINPEHQKAQRALQKARAEEERSAIPGETQ